MKKGFLLILLVFIASNSFSQANKEKQRKIKWGCSFAINSLHGQIGFFQISSGAIGAQFIDSDGNLLSGGNKKDNSLSLSIVPKYFISDDLLLRCEFGITNLNISSNFDSKYYSTHQITNITIKNKIHRYNLGIQWTTINKKFAKIFCGGTGTYLKYDNLVYEGYSEHRALPIDTLSYWVKSKTTIPGGYAIGIGGLLGFNIYLQRHVSVGLEFSSALLFYKSKGDIVNENSSQVLPDPSIITEEDQFGTSYSGIRISKILSTINISYWF